MKPKALYLAWRYLLFHKMKTTILLACLGLTFLLPLGVHFLVGYYETTLAARALGTPLVIGAPGNRFDLVLKSLYFATDYADAVDMCERAVDVGAQVRDEIHVLWERGEVIDAIEGAAEDAPWIDLLLRLKLAAEFDSGDLVHHAIDARCIAPQDGVPRTDRYDPPLLQQR